MHGFCRLQRTFVRAPLLIGARLSATGLLGGVQLQDTGLRGDPGPLGTGGAGLRCFSANTPSAGTPKLKLKVFIRRELGGADVAKVTISEDDDLADLVKLAAAEVLPGIASGSVSLWKINGDGANATKKEMTNLRATVGAELLGATAVLVSLRPPPPPPRPPPPPPPPPGDQPFDASLGIAQASVCADPQSLKDRIAFVHEQTQSDALVEEYIEGREIYVGVLGNDRLTTLPVWEMNFGSLAEGQAPIATRKVKWDRRYIAHHGISTAAATDLSDAVMAQIRRLTKRIYRALHLTGYARMDFRLRNDGTIFVLEANANPNLAEVEDLARSAQAAGLGYDELLARILSLGIGYQAAWRSNEA